MALSDLPKTASSPSQHHGRLVRLKNLSAIAVQKAALQTATARSPSSEPLRNFTGRWTRRHWAHASLFATLGALVASIVPGFNHAMQGPIRLQQTSMSLALPQIPRSRTHERSLADWQIVHVQSGQTLSHIFGDLNIPHSDLQRVLDYPGVKSVLTKLKPGTEIAFNLPVNGALQGFRFDRDDTHRIELSLNGDRIKEQVIERPVETRTVVISGEVGKSLFHSARKLGMSGGNINTLTDEIFKYDIDFNSDVGSKDRFSAVIEQTWREGELIKSGPVLAATFTTRGKLHSGFRYVRGEKAEYFSGDGRPLKKSFIRMPIPYARLTSKFGARRHPVLGILRQHTGVDYAASTGTPIMAAGDARVQFVGWKGGYGRAVILDHGKGYTTLYGHMSGFGDIKAGQRIAQGTVIGRVGSTGLATGPHLHYEFRVNGVHRNPLSITMPPPEPLTGAQLADFRSQTRPALARIEEVEKIIYAQVAPMPKQVAALDRGKKG